ncbi:hypothetical protein CEXT_470281 [Caerostris extrusa]|uniref:Uncharacterized protein n=1 Tax=Caerostris extrusa TaxID=172846 RepID=A0AAV4QEL8_CAEEX|nr:hypothetical protein CEXT_470281 [Caerostris extrusa]
MIRPLFRKGLDLIYSLDLNRNTKEEAVWAQFILVWSPSPAFDSAIISCGCSRGIRPDLQPGFEPDSTEEAVWAQSILVWSRVLPSTAPSLAQRMFGPNQP